MGVSEKSNRLNRSQWSPDDEYYTRYEHVEFIFNNYLKDVDFKDKIIYCFCDSEESNFVKYLKDNKLRLGLKDIWFTSDDYNKHVDLFKEADYVISNPPFSKIIRDLYCLLKQAKQFFILGSFQNLYCYNIVYHDIKDIRFFYWNDILETIFHNNEKKVSICYLTNIKEAVDLKEKYIYTNTFENLKKEGKEIYFDWGKYKDELYVEHVLNIDKLCDIPIDYDGYMAVPITVLTEDKRWMFDVNWRYVRFYSNDPEYKKIRNVEGQCGDGKIRFKRQLIKIKSPYLTHVESENQR